MLLIYLQWLLSDVVTAIKLLKVKLNAFLNVGYSAIFDLLHSYRDIGEDFVLQPRHVPPIKEV